jgi:thiol-disulfide isomerase/thioredoxin
MWKILRPRLTVHRGIIVFLLTALVIALPLPLHSSEISTVDAQEDGPEVEINRLAEQVHIQNLRTRNVTLWTGGTLGAANGSELGSDAGSVFTDWTFGDLYDESVEITLDDMQRPALMNVWASWCGPCRYEFPFLADYALNRDNSYDIWFLNAADTSPSAAVRFLNSQPEGLNAYIDPNDVFTTRIGVRVFPTTILMDTDGTLLAAHSGIVTPTVMRFFDAVASNPGLGSIDTDSIPIPDLVADIQEIDPATATPLDYGQQVVGQITNEEWQQNYRFEGQAGDEIVIDLIASEDEFDPLVVLLGPDGERIAENDDGPNWPDSQIITTLPEDGTYTIAATRFLEADGLEYGGFTLRIATPEQLANDSSAAIALLPDIPMSARLSTTRTRHSYLLNARAGQQVTLSLEHNSPGEEVFIEVRQGASERIVPYTTIEDTTFSTTFEAPASAEYSVYISRSSSSDAEPIVFTVTATIEGEGEKIQPEETDIQTATEELTYGDTVRDTIDDESFEQTYTFTGEEGDIITIRMEAAEDSALDPLLHLLLPSDDEPVVNDDASPSTRDAEISAFSLPASGEYTIIATRYNGETGLSSGDFNLSLTLVEPTDEASETTDEDATETDETDETAVEDEDESGARAINYGATITSSISDEVYEEFYTFDGSAGDVVTIRMFNVTGTQLDTLLILQGPDGGELARNDDMSNVSSNSLIEEFTLPQDGQYTIIATRYNGAEGETVGIYQLLLRLTAPEGEEEAENSDTDTADEVSAATSISYGDTVSGEITDENYEQSFAFEGNEGDSVTIRLAADGSSLDTVVQLLGPDGEILAENDDSSFSSTDSLIENFTLPADGQYTIIATRYNGAEGQSVGDFVLELITGTAEEEGETAAEETETISLSYGETVSGELDDENYRDFYTFNAEAGDTITISMEAAEDSSLDTLFILFGPGEERLLENDDGYLGSTDSLIEGFDLVTSGQYTIVATRYGGEDGDSSGAYHLTLTSTSTSNETADETAPIPEAQAELVYGDSLTGNIDNETFIHSYTFDGQAGDVVTIRMDAGEGSTLDSLLRLYGPDGDLLIENDDAQLTTTNALIEDFELPTDGEYTLVATRYNGEAGFSFGEFSLSLISGSTPPLVAEPGEETAEVMPLAFGETVASEIDATSLAERYQFEGTAGTTITITMQSASGDLDSYLSLLGPDGKEIAFNDDDLSNGGRDSAIRDFTLPADGTYTIIATRYGVKYGATTGSFELVLIENSTP